MLKLSEMHDGFFDGLWIAGDSWIHLFLRTSSGVRATLILGGVEAANVQDLRQGNIVLDLQVIAPEHLTVEDIAEAYQLTPNEARQSEKLLSETKSRSLSVLNVNPSYGAQCTFLYRSAEMVEGHVTN